MLKMLKKNLSKLKNLQNTFIRLACPLVLPSMALSLILLHCNPALASSQWNGKNNPENMAQETNYTNGHFEYHFDNLPLSGRLQTHPWACTFWPTRRQGVASRWHGPVHTFNGKTQNFSREDLLAMAARDPRNLENLSAVEKYDIYRGDYNYTLTGQEKCRTGNCGTASAWAGLCHGWAPASLNFKEPHRTTVLNRDGISITFFSADIKGLLSLLQGAYTESEECYQVGTKNLLISRSNDINAGALHVLLANRIGRFNRGFCCDLDSGRQVWNHPVEGYNSVVLERRSNRVLVETTITYPGDDESYATENSLNNDSGNENFRLHKTYRYYLFLDMQGNIIGGYYVGGDAHPDFAWSVPKGKFTGIFTELEDLYEKATQDVESVNNNPI
ncbi:MAG: hypothetical protein HQK53_01835 [Oligoflexia bacterium]|nr:hypothetical protein [Oligoflexia bacterium]